MRYFADNTQGPLQYQCLPIKLDARQKTQSQLVAQNARKRKLEKESESKVKENKKEKR